MKTVLNQKLISQLTDLFGNKMLSANPEYQRGAVWNDTQKKKLIDSVLRGYQLPLIYLHHIVRDVAGHRREDFEVIDGQQRINALYEFSEGAFSLFDPVKDDAKAKFPSFIKRQPCPWAGKTFASLEPELKKQFNNTVLPVAMIETTDANEVRDLFIRLQSGLPLNAQETRDAWPGKLTHFILGLGGKPDIKRYPGHSFFKETLGMKPQADRGKTRQLAAQIAMLYLTRREKGVDAFCDINSSAIDSFYYSNLDFDETSKESVRLLEILDKLASLLDAKSRRPLKGHDAIHLVLLADMLWDDYARSWEDRLPKALDRFLEQLAKAADTKDSDQPSEFWLHYGQWTRVNSDRGDRIARRHHFYARKMLEFLQPLQKLDTKRLFGDLEREVLFYQQNKSCAVCDGIVDWRDAEVHHVDEHYKGGPTKLENGALVHAKCHPKGDSLPRLSHRSSAPNNRPRVGMQNQLTICCDRREHVLIIS